MISFIICSVNKSDLNLCLNSIQNSIGFPHEFIIIDNIKEKLSLSCAYNKGASLSNFNYLVFIHEDLEFLSINWGEMVVDILKDVKYGIVGLAGSTYLPSVPSGWYLPDEVFNKVYIRQGFKYKELAVRFDNHGEDLTPMYLLDGVFLAMRKEVWQEFPFNENLDGFHAYDVDICQRVSAKYQNVFTKQIELLHKSEGKVDKTYFDAILKYKLSYSNFAYPKRNHKLEYALLNQFYSHLRCYYDKKDCIEKISPFIKSKYLGWKGYLSFKQMLRHAK